MSEWYYKKWNRETGPVTDERLRELCSCNELGKRSLVRKSDSNTWISLGESDIFKINSADNVVFEEEIMEDEPRVDDHKKNIPVKVEIKKQENPALFLNAYYYANKNNQQCGPISDIELVILFRKGFIDLDTLIYHHLFPTWIKFKDSDLYYSITNKLDKCPVCQSDNIKRLEILYAEGTIVTTSTTSAGGIGISKGGIMVGGGGGSTTGISQNSLAQIIAPPNIKKPEKRTLQGDGMLVPVCLVFGIICLLCFAVNLQVGVIVAGFSYALIYIARTGTLEKDKKAKDYNDNIYPRLLAEWNDIQNEWKAKYMCLKCGVVFIP